MPNESHDLLLENEREWRRYMMKKVDGIDNKMNGLMIKVATLSTLVSLLAPLILKKFGL